MQLHDAEGLCLVELSVGHQDRGDHDDQERHGDQQPRVVLETSDVCATVAVEVGLGERCAVDPRLEGMGERREEGADGRALGNLDVVVACHGHDIEGRSQPADLDEVVRAEVTKGPHLAQGITPGRGQVGVCRRRLRGRQVVPFGQGEMVEEARLAGEQHVVDDARLTVRGVTRGRAEDVGPCCQRRLAERTVGDLRVGEARIVRDREGFADHDRGPLCLGALPLSSFTKATAKLTAASITSRATRTRLMPDDPVLSSVDLLHRG